jgi:hypothetical protein
VNAARSLRPVLELVGQLFQPGNFGVGRHANCDFAVVLPNAINRATETHCLGVQNYSGVIHYFNPVRCLRKRMQYLRGAGSGRRSARSAASAEPCPGGPRKVRGF